LSVVTFTQPGSWTKRKTCNFIDFQPNQQLYSFEGQRFVVLKVLKQEFWFFNRKMSIYKILVRYANGKPFETEMSTN
jgi:hypothetical protein